MSRGVAASALALGIGAATAVGVSAAVAGFPSDQRGDPTIERSGATAGASVLRFGGASFDGSTIVSMASTFQPGLIYKKFPSDQPVVPAQSWQLSFGAVLSTAAPSVAVTLRVDEAHPNPSIQIVDDAGDFVLQDGLFNNYAAAERFEIQYTGAFNPYLGPIDFVLAPDGLPEIPVRVHLDVVERTGFPKAFSIPSSGTAVVGNIAGDEALEILLPGRAGEFPAPEGLHAFDAAGNSLPGWPIFTGEPGPDSGAFRTPTVVDLDGDGHDEIVVIGITSTQEVAERGTASSAAGSTTTLYVVEGSGQIRWQATMADFEDFSIPAVADLDGDGDMDILTSTLTNLTRFEADGTHVASWHAETLNDIFTNNHVAIGELDGNAANGKEIAACGSVPGPNMPEQVYVWREDGSLLTAAWPKEFVSCHTPVLVELDRNSANGSELVVAVDFFANPPVDPKTGFLNTFTVFAWHGDGSDVAGWPHRVWRDPNAGLIDDRVTFAVAADVDGNGDAEVVVGVYGQGDPANGNLFVFHHDGALDPRWPQWGGLAQIGGAAVADLDGDGRLDIVTGSFHGVFAFHDDGTPLEGFPRKTPDNFAHAVIADLDRNGRLDVIQPSLLGVFSAWELLTPTLDRVAWPQYRQNAAHTGTRVDGPIAAIPAVSEYGLAVMVVLVIGAGARMLRRR